MQSKQELLPAAEVLSGLGGPVKAIREASPQARHHFTLSDQVNQLVSASEADPDLGFMARMMALCSLPRTNRGATLQYKRVNGPYKLVMIAGADCKLPFGNLPRLLLAWVSTEAVRTQSRELVLGRSLAEFMRTLGVYSSGGRVQIRLRNQMRRLFSATVQLVYEDEHGEARVSSSVADRTEFWWNESKPDEPSLWESKLRLGEDFFHEIIQHPVPIDMNQKERCARTMTDVKARVEGILVVNPTTTTSCGRKITQPVGEFPSAGPSVPVCPAVMSSTLATQLRLFP